MTERAGALAGRRVVEIASERTAHCGKLLADLGAQVCLVEPPGGHRSRLAPPFVQDRPGATRSFGFLARNGGKASVELDLECDAGRARLHELIADAHLCITGLAPAELEALALTEVALAESAPQLVLTCITGFGLTGPRRDWRSSDLIASAMGGAMHLIGFEQDPPVRLAGEQALVSAGTVAAVASLCALRASDAEGRGQVVDVSLQEVVASVSHICGIAKWRDDGIVAKRWKTSLFASVPSGAYRCADGLIYLMVNRPLHWQALAKWVHERTGNEEVLAPMFHGPSSVRLPHRELLDLFLDELFLGLSAREAYVEGQRRHLAITPLRGLEAVCADEHLAARAFFSSFEQPGVGTVATVGAAHRLSSTPCREPAPVPEVGEGVDAWPALVRNTDASQRDSEPGGGATAGALAGLRVLELTQGMAGPWIGRFMAYCGADVIRVESRKRPDVVRLYIPPRAPERGVDAQGSPWFTDWNAGKRFVALDLTRPEAVEIVKRLVAHADVVVENMSHGVLDKLGLGFDALRAHRPDLVMLSSTGYGATGPGARHVTWGPNIEALSGLAAQSGFPDREATLTQFAYPDALSALDGMVAVLAALEHRDCGGGGQHIDLSQQEIMVASMAPLVLECLATGVAPAVLGNASTVHAPHGVFRCAGDDAWCAIAVLDDAHWPLLASTIDRPDWATEPELATVEGRRARSVEIDLAIEAWTEQRSPADAMQRLQTAGIAAGAVQTVADLAQDPQLAARSFFETIAHRHGAPVVATGIPLRFSRSSTGTRDTGAAVGEDADEVFRGLLGMSEAEIQAAEATGAIEASGVRISGGVR